MQNYIDQALFDSGVLMLGAFGVEKFELEHFKFNLEEFIEFGGVIREYENLRPQDNLYKTQTMEALSWLITSTPISSNIDRLSDIYRSAYEIRKSLNADMQPLSMREKIFRGAIFQPESKNYLNRLIQCKLNISTILREISNDHKNIYNLLPEFERRLNSNSIYTFISKATDLLIQVLHKPYREDSVLWETKFHQACLIAASCYHSANKRFENFPLHLQSKRSAQIADEIRNAICHYANGHINKLLATNVIDFYISDHQENQNSLYEKSESGIWNSLRTQLTTPKYSDDDELYEFLEIGWEQINSYDHLSVFDIDYDKLGGRFLDDHALV